jgi:hypothetical protein
LNGTEVPAEGLKWRVNRAVKRSTLPPPSRLLMFVLSDRADARTAVIPDGHLPSQSELADETGLGIATVKRHLEGLTADGWIVREVPTEQGRARGERTRYRLATGGSTPPPSTAQSDTSSTAHSDTSSTYQSDTASTAQTELSSERAELALIPELVSERSLSTAQTDTSSYLNDRYDQDDQVLAANAASTDSSDALFDAPPTKAKPKRSRKPRGDGSEKKAESGDSETAARNKLAVELAQQWYAACEKKPSGSFVGRQQIVYGLLEAGHEPDDIAEALGRCGFSMTRNSAEYQLKRLAEERQRDASVVVSIHRGKSTGAYRDDPNRDYSLAGYLAQRNGA